jgi:hypothetical protein
MLDQMIENINERGMIPPELNPEGMHKPAAVLHVLDHLASYWASSPPVRGSERTPAPARISVVHGFDSILSMVSGESQELDFNSNVEIWSVENESDGGLEPSSRKR